MPCWGRIRGFPMGLVRALSFTPRLRVRFALDVRFGADSGESSVIPSLVLLPTHSARQSGARTIATDPMNPKHESASQGTRPRFGPEGVGLTESAEQPKGSGSPLEPPSSWLPC